jgi:hypothetical protein
MAELRRLKAAVEEAEVEAKPVPVLEVAARKEAG